MKQFPEFKADRLAWRFRKSGGGGVHCKQFVEHEPQVQRQLRERANVVEGEVPSVASYVGEHLWALITDRRVVWERGSEGVRELPFSELADATAEGSALLAAGRKSAVTELTLVARSGERYRLEVEAGPPFSGFWNALKAAATERGSR